MIDVEIDKLTNSVEEVASGRSYDTEIVRAKLKDVRPLNDWRFNWQLEIKEREVWQMVIPKVSREIQGLISLKRERGYVHVVLIESHPANIGRGKLYAGVAGNLMAQAAKLSFELGNGGYVAFDAKTRLIAHYEKTLGAQRVGTSQRMVIDSTAATFLVSKYFGGQDGTHART